MLSSLPKHRRIGIPKDVQVKATTLCCRDRCIDKLINRKLWSASKGCAESDLIDRAHCLCKKKKYPVYLNCTLHVIPNRGNSKIVVVADCSNCPKQSSMGSRLHLPIPSLFQKCNIIHPSSNPSPLLTKYRYYAHSFPPPSNHHHHHHHLHLHRRHSPFPSLSAASTLHLTHQLQPSSHTPFSRFQIHYKVLDAWVMVIFG